jgi:2-hydroxy-3-keto-5-methylthiopentenyl-1-phosphate phosphatase
MDACDLCDVLVVMDFDGTITTRDCLRTVLAHHVADLDALTTAARATGLSEAQALLQAVGRLRAPREQVLAEFAAAATLRAGFHDFARFLLERGARIALISLGFAEGIEAVWRREGLPEVPVLASRLEGDESVGYRLRVDQRFGDCPICGAGLCKGPAVDALRQPGDYVVAFGDGERDLCMARRADLVFARDGLADRCDREQIDCLPLTDYTRALRDLRRRLAERGSDRRPPRR